MENVPGISQRELKEKIAFNAPLNASENLTKRIESFRASSTSGIFSLTLNLTKRIESYTLWTIIFGLFIVESHKEN